MTSKAAAALSRVREIDKKYKSKQEKRYSISSESLKSIDTEKPQKLLKPQLNIKMPDPYEEYMNVDTSSESKKYSVPINIICELSRKSSNSNDHSENNNNLEGHETMSGKINIINENMSRKDETNESISEILEDTQSPSQISTKSTKSEKSADDKYDKNSSLNLLTRNETSKSDEKIRTEEEYEEEEEEIEEEKQKEKKLDLENKNSFVHYSDESFESSSSEPDNSQSTAISKQLQLKINHEKGSSKVPTIFSKNDTNTSDDIATDCLNVSHNKLQESEKKLSTSTENSNPSNTYNDTTSNKQSSDESKSKNGKINDKDDNNITDDDKETIKTAKKICSESEITPKCSNKQQINSSQSTSQVLVIFNRKSNKNKSKESDDTIETIKSLRQISSSSSTSSSTSSQITKPKDPEKVNMHHKRKHVYHKPNEKYCSPAMINYVRKMREEQQKLHIQPTQMICLDKIKIQSIKPLEFPKILDFVQNDEYKNSDFNLEILQNHLSNIRQWLKEQYLIYKEKSEVAEHINKNYHPTTLNETKKVIYQLQSKARAKNKNQ